MATLLVGASASARGQAAAAGASSARAAAAMQPAGPAQLDDLLSRLGSSRDEHESSAIEERLFEIWSKSGDAEADSVFNLGLVAMAYRDLAHAEEMFIKATERAPNFIEAWNRLGSVHYLEGEYAEALRDADRTLLIERRHFGALAGRGMVLVALGDERGALMSFELALSVNPASAGL
jgi:tetratricopeptide (TPR) repeat protein